MKIQELDKKIDDALNSEEPKPFWLNSVYLQGFNNGVKYARKRMSKTLDGLNKPSPLNCECEIKN